MRPSDLQAVQSKHVSLQTSGNKHVSRDLHQNVECRVNLLIVLFTGFDLPPSVLAVVHISWYMYCSFVYTTC